MGEINYIIGMQQKEINSKSDLIAYLNRNLFRYDYILPNSCAYKITGERDFTGTMYREDFIINR
jgi:hypothetical protein